MTYLDTCFTCIFNYRKKFTKAKKQLSDQDQKALFAKLMKLELIDFIFKLDFLKRLHNYQAHEGEIPPDLSIVPTKA